MNKEKETFIKGYQEGQRFPDKETIQKIISEYLVYTLTKSDNKKYTNYIDYIYDKLK